ncbi:MAG: FAD:protein FMN transferase, partial [Thermoanaerobaculia bacterium]|nr:FAD:protein FMN transferase [Thermoanaerobaculia bacterium]
VSAATTGNGQRGLSVEGRPVGHLLDPRTGRPAEDFGSLTVIAPSAFRADCLSTGLFVLGPKEAVVRAEELPGIEAVALSVTEDRTAVEITSGLRERVRPVEGSMSVKAGVLEGPQPDEGNEERFTWTVERSPSPMTTFVGVPAPAEER